MQAAKWKIAAACGLFATLGACASLPDPTSASSLSADQRFAQVQSGNTQDEVRRLIGSPHLTSTGWRSAQTVWVYRFTDAWGYSSEFDVMFGANGVVANTFSQRINP